MKKQKQSKNLVLNKKTVSLLKEKAQKGIRGAGVNANTTIPDSPLCAPTFQRTCDTETILTTKA